MTADSSMVQTMPEIPLFTARSDIKEKLRLRTRSTGVVMTLKVPDPRKNCWEKHGINPKQTSTREKECKDHQKAVLVC